MIQKFILVLVLGLNSSWAFENTKENVLSLNENKIYQGKNAVTGSPCGVFIRNMAGFGTQVFYRFDQLPASSIHGEINANSLSWNLFDQISENEFRYMTGGRWSRDCRYSSSSCVIVQYYIYTNTDFTLNRFEYAEDSDRIQSCIF